MTLYMFMYVFCITKAVLVYDAICTLNFFMEKFVTNDMPIEICEKKFAIPFYLHCIWKYFCTVQKYNTVFYNTIFVQYCDIV